ncbi:hypothetical protein ACFL03_10050 [Thermodesulfobacteriota bacterium]
MKAPIKSGLFFICICYLFIAETTFAGNIALRMQATLTIAAGRIEVRITTANLGTEPARDLQAFLHIFNRNLASDTTPRLDVGQTRSFFFRLPVSAKNKGRFAFIAEALYHDANQKPFSALACDVFRLKHKAAPDLTGAATDMTFKGKGRLPVQISNPLPHALNCTATLHLPRGLTAPIKEQKVMLASNSQKTIEFQLFDPYEIGDAAYPVFCIIEYEKNGTHGAVIVSSTVYVKGFKNWFKQTRWWWLAGLVPIVLMWIAVLFPRKKLKGNNITEKQI